MIIILFSSISFAYPIPNAFPPFRIAGNLYYVGTDDLATYLIVTPKGNILINSNLDVTVPMIKSSVEQLGFRWADTRILLVSHAHLDHAGGSQRIKQETNAEYMVMDADIPVVESGGKSDFFYSNDASMYFPAVKVDKALHDGDQVKLGGTVLTAHLTPGHTKGCTTWTMEVMDHGRKYHVVIVGSVNVNESYPLIHHKTYPNIADDFKAAIKTLKSLPCDIFLGAHAVYFDLKKKYTLLKNNAVKNPFVDLKGYHDHIVLKEREYQQVLKQQSK